ncbi:hypothetical protein EYF80_040774 [Liparis tanakae]|uniref:Uncharacterized protein n=1 Tax=Liparis tanakae TaxID=230148 RepID=A0A4Z2G8Z8_9TELE|nr:hypothetical protein EYF80_040774 [Liparis tanakae]
MRAGLAITQEETIRTRADNHRDRKCRGQRTQEVPGVHYDSDRPVSPDACPSGTREVTSVVFSEHSAGRCSPGTGHRFRNTEQPEPPPRGTGNTESSMKDTGNSGRKRGQSDHVSLHLTPFTWQEVTRVLNTHMK